MFTFNFNCPFIVFFFISDKIFVISCTTRMNVWFAFCISAAYCFSVLFLNSLNSLICHAMKIMNLLWHIDNKMTKTLQKLCWITTQHNNNDARMTSKNTVFKTMFATLSKLITIHINLLSKSAFWVLTVLWSYCLMLFSYNQHLFEIVYSWLFGFHCYLLIINDNRHLGSQLDKKKIMNSRFWYWILLKKTLMIFLIFIKIIRTFFKKKKNQSQFLVKSIWIQVNVFQTIKRKTIPMINAEFNMGWKHLF